MEKIWLKAYQPGVPADINPNEYQSLVDLFRQSCRQHAPHIAYENMGTGISYAELEQYCTHLSAYVQQLKLSKGARIAIMMPNVLQYPIALFAILQAGYVVVNTNPLYTTDEITHQLKDAGAEAIIILANFAHTLQAALPQLPHLKHIIITRIGDFFPPWKRHLVNAVVRHIKKLERAYHLPNAVSLRQALSIGQQHAYQEPSLHHQDIAFLQYTGGTTGIAKAAILTHGNMVANVLQAYAWIAPRLESQKEIIITALPLYHIFSLTANCLTFLKLGARNVLITNPRQINTFIKQIKSLQFTAITGVNTLFNALLNHPKFSTVDFSKLKLALSGGMALQKTVASKWRAVTHSPILEAYGLTETSPAVTMNPLHVTDYNGSIGLPISSTEVSLRDEQGREVPLGERGELCVRGPQVMQAYWGQPAETAQVFCTDGFIRTGDIAIMDEHGYLYVVDRKKDMIIVSGFNVYPNEVEKVISMLPGVLEVGVIGIKENNLERIKACIVKKDSQLCEEDVIEFCKQHLTAYKIPKIVTFYDELPKTNVGKILRRALKAECTPT